MMMTPYDQVCEYKEQLIVRHMFFRDLRSFKLNYEGKDGRDNVGRGLRLPHLYKSSTSITGKTHGLTGMKKCRTLEDEKTRPLPGD